MSFLIPIHTWFTGWFDITLILTRNSNNRTYTGFEIIHYVFILVDVDESKVGPGVVQL